MTPTTPATTHVCVTVREHIRSENATQTGLPATTHVCVTVREHIRSENATQTEWWAPR